MQGPHLNGPRHHSALEFRVAAYSRAIVAIPICREQRLYEFQVRVL